MTGTHVREIGPSRVGKVRNPVSGFREAVKVLCGQRVQSALAPNTPAVAPERASAEELRS